MLRTPRGLLIPIVGSGDYFHRRETQRPHYFTKGVVFLAAQCNLCPLVLPVVECPTVIDKCAACAGAALVSNGRGRFSHSLSSTLVPASKLAQKLTTIPWCSLSASTVFENASQETSASWPWRVEGLFCSSGFGLTGTLFLCLRTMSDISF